MFWISDPWEWGGQENPVTSVPVLYVLQEGLRSPID